MKLHWSPRSPFVRKVMIVLHEKGLTGRVERIRTVAMMTAIPKTDLLRDNPLGKIPALVLDDGTTLFDSRVICEYLDGVGEGGALLPAAFELRIECLRWQALGDGVTDILLLWRVEQGRGHGINQMVSDGFDAKVRAAMARLDAEASILESRPFGLGHISIVCMLAQLDFRFPDCGWRAAYPALAKWSDQSRLRPSFLATEVRDDGAAAMGEVVMPLSFSGPLVTPSPTTAASQ